MDVLKINELAARAKSYIHKNLNEEQTKHALILPFIEAIGYDAHDPFEVAAEFVSDAGKRGREKIDYAILQDNKPVILIECKACGVPLGKDQCAQLRRYFAAHTSAHIGILTNGVQYSIFADIHEPNIMDDTPFLEFDILNFNEQLLPHIQHISKHTWNIGEIMNTGIRLQDFNALLGVINDEISNPSDDFVRYFLSRAIAGRITSKALQDLRPTFVDALQTCLDNYVNRRLELSKVPPRTIDVNAPADGAKPGVVTTNTEMWAYVIVRTLLHEAVDSSRVFMRDQKTYCAVLLDNNNRNAICRFFNFGHWNEGDPNIGQNAHILIFNTEDGEKFPIRFVDDIYPLKDKLIAAARRLKKDCKNG
jgi:hypothetical protein